MLASWYRKYRSQGLVVVGITEMSPTVADVKKAAHERGLSYPIVIDKGERIFRQYGLESHPTTILVDRAGKVARVEVGYVRGDEKTIEASMLPLIRGGAHHPDNQNRDSRPGGKR